MRATAMAWAAAAIALGCGTNQGGSGSQGPDGGAAKRLLNVHVAGSGAVQVSAATCRADCQLQFDEGQAIQLAAVPDSGWKFDGWGGECTGTGKCELTMSANHAVSATFSSAAPPPPGNVRLEVKTSGDGTGRIVSSPGGIDCPGACSMSITAGTAVLLAAQANPNSTFTGFGGACSGATCSLTVNADSIVWANFTANPPPPPPRHTLTVTVDGQGRVTSSPAGMDCAAATCSAAFDSGAMVTLSAAAGSGWTFGSWSGACSGSGACVVKLDADVQVSAHFNAPPPPPTTAHVIVTVSGRGQVTGSGISCGSGAATCDATVAAGATVTLNAAAASQARFMGWKGPCSGAAAGCSFAANGEVRVTASFQDLVTTLVVNDGTNLSSLALNSSDAFYGRYTGAEGGSIWAVPKAGGQPRRVTSGSASWLVADDGFVYWSDYSAIYSAPVGGGQGSVIFSGSGIGRMALDAQGALYFIANTGATNQGSVHRMQDRADKVLVSSATLAPGIAVDGSFVYFTSLDGTNNGFLSRVPKSGGTAETIIGCGTWCQPPALKVDSANLYVRSQAGQVWTVAKASPSLLLLSGPNGGSYWGYALEIDAWGSVVYWNFTSSQNGTNGIFSANSDGSQWTAIDTSRDSGWFMPRVDEQALYYWHGGSLIRRLK